MNLYLSIIIPAFNEEKRISKTLDAIQQYVVRKEFASEIIVVDDGSQDGTASLVREKTKHVSNLRLVQSPHAGKGAAVKSGVLGAKGELRLFMDADGSTSIDELDKLLPYANQYDIVIGSRLAKGAVKKTRQNRLREFLGWGFRTLVYVFIATDVQDTQNGFKLFSKTAAEKIFSTLTIAGWSFDVEVLAVAKKYNLKVKEVPIVWVNDGRSKMRFSHMVQMFFDLLRIHQIYKR